jgi:HEAT repeat protein
MAIRFKSSQSPVTFESVRNNALLGTNEAVDILREHLNDADANVSIKAAQALVGILSKIADIGVVEQLPLLEELEELAKKKVA